MDHGDEQVLTIHVHNGKHMRRLGQLFGRVFMRPLVRSENGNPAHHITISAYGISESKKTTFFRALASGVEQKAYEDLSWQKQKLEAIDTGNSLFRYADLGEHAYPLGRMDWEHNGKSRKEWLTTDCDLKKLAVTDKPGFSLIEHPSIPHFFGSQIVALFGYTFEFGQTTSYFYKARQSIEDLASLDQTGFDKRKIFDQMQNVSRYMLCRQINRMTRVERILSLVLTQPTQSIQKAFNHFRKQAAQMTPY